MTAPASASIAAAPITCSPTRIARRKGMAAQQPSTSVSSRLTKQADAVYAEITALLDMSYGDLKERWQEVYGAPAPKNLSRRLMIYALAYEVQARTYGGLSQAMKQQLRNNAVASLTKAHATIAPVTLSPGTRLMREWRGVVHVVDRTAEGFLWNGRTFSSLSAIARAITGVRWNGLAFFGLRKRSNTGKANAGSLAA